MAAKYGSREALDSTELKRPGIVRALAQTPMGTRSGTGALTYEDNKRSYIEAAEAFETEGFTVTEHALYGGVADVHAKDKDGKSISFHGYNEAFDVIIKRPGRYDDDIAGMTRLKNLMRSLGLFKEVIGPGDGDANHSHHVHLGGLMRPLTPADIEKINSLDP